jgi:hypothetical protein
VVEGALKIGRRRQQSRRFFVMVGVVEMENFWLMALLTPPGSLVFSRSKVAVGK